MTSKSEKRMTSKRNRMFAGALLAVRAGRSLAADVKRHVLDE